MHRLLDASLPSSSYPAFITAAKCLLPSKVNTHSFRGLDMEMMGALVPFTTPSHPDF